MFTTMKPNAVHRNTPYLLIAAFLFILAVVLYTLATMRIDPPPFHHLDTPNQTSGAIFTTPDEKAATPNTGRFLTQIPVGGVLINRCDEGIANAVVVAPNVVEVACIPDAP